MSTSKRLNTKASRATDRRRRLAGPALLTAAAFSLTTFATVIVPSAAQAATGPELVANGGFDQVLTGWVPNKMDGGKGTTLSQVPGRNSAGAARITANFSGLATLNDSPDTVSSTTQFDEYTGTAFVRTSTPGVSLQLRVQEMNGTEVVGTGSSAIALNDTAWHPITTSYTAAYAGSGLNFNVISYSMAAGKSFEVDDVSLTAGSYEQSTTVWAPVYRNDFVDMRDVNATYSSAAVNSTALPSDSTSATLMKPTVKSNVVVSNDPAAGDGKVLAVHTRQASYPTSTGAKVGWTNGRMTISGASHAPPVKVKVRMKFTPSIKTKSAVMWWPTGGGWPWETDMAETFSGNTLTDYWGGRQHVSQRWHGDVDGDGSANEQIIHDDALDATVFHVYELTINADSMSMTIDGEKTFETRDMDYIPNSTGFFTIGKALGGRRDATDRTNDAVYVDWLEISKPA